MNMTDRLIQQDHEAHDRYYRAFLRRCIMGAALTAALFGGLAFLHSAKAQDQQCHTLDAVKKISVSSFVDKGAAEPTMLAVEGDEAKALFAYTGGSDEALAKVSKLLLVQHETQPGMIFVVAFDENGCAFLAAMLRSSPVVLLDKSA